MKTDFAVSNARERRQAGSPNRLGTEQHYAPLDGIRGLAIFGVFALHYGGGRHLGSPLLRFIGEIAFRGGLGVDLFFVLSGYLITRILLGSVRDQNYYRTFYARRTLRIFPLYYGVLLGLLVTTPWFGFHWQALHFAYPLYLQNVAELIRPGLPEISAAVTLGAFWSLAVEEQFYLIWPWLIKVCSRATWRAAWLFAIALAAPLLIRLVAVQPGSLVACYRLLPCRVDTLACGALLAFLAAHHKLLLVPKWVPYLMFSGCAAIVIYLTSSGAPVNLLPTIGLTFAAFGCAALIWLTLWPTSLAARVFSVAPLRFLGRYSYGLYVYHQIWHGALQNYLLPAFVRATGSAAVGSVLFFVAALALNLVVAVLSYHCFEIHFLRLKKYFCPESHERNRASSRPMSLTASGSQACES